MGGEMMEEMDKGNELKNIEKKEGYQFSFGFGN